VNQSNTYRSNSKACSLGLWIYKFTVKIEIGARPTAYLHKPAQIIAKRQPNQTILWNSLNPLILKEFKWRGNAPEFADIRRIGGACLPPPISY